MKYEKGKVARGTVTGITPYGIFLAFEDFYTGLIHISEISHGYVKDVNNFVELGDNIYVEILEVEEDSHNLKLSIKNIAYKNKRKYSGKQKKIVEVGSGFMLISDELENWIDKKIKKIKKADFFIDNI